MNAARRRYAIALVVVAACAEPTIPDRTAGYGFTDFLGNVFHWPSDRLPVRVYADPRGGLPTFVARGIDLWEQQFLYGEFRGVMTSDSTHADVIVLWADSVPPDVPPDNGPAAKACGGLTTAYIDSTGTALTGPFRTQINILTGTVYTAAQVNACVRRTAVHELGHGLGLLQESPDSLRDIMASPPHVNLPGDRDRQTVELLYHTTPTLRPAP